MAISSFVSWVACMLSLPHINVNRVYQAAIQQRTAHVRQRLSAPLPKPSPRYRSTGSKTKGGNHRHNLGDLTRREVFAQRVKVHLRCPVGYFACGKGQGYNRAFRFAETRRILKVKHLSPFFGLGIRAALMRSVLCLYAPDSIGIPR